MFVYKQVESKLCELLQELVDSSKAKQLFERYRNMLQLCVWDYITKHHPQFEVTVMTQAVDVACKVYYRIRYYLERHVGNMLTQMFPNNMPVDSNETYTKKYRRYRDSILDLGYKFLLSTYSGRDDAKGNALLQKLVAGTFDDLFRKRQLVDETVWEAIRERFQPLLSRREDLNAIEALRGAGGIEEKLRERLWDDIQVSDKCETSVLQSSLVASASILIEEEEELFIVVQSIVVRESEVFLVRLRQKPELADYNLSASDVCEHQRVIRNRVWCDMLRMSPGSLDTSASAAMLAAGYWRDVEMAISATPRATAPAPSPVSPTFAAAAATNRTLSGRGSSSRHFAPPPPPQVPPPPPLPQDPRMPPHDGGSPRQLKRRRINSQSVVDLR